MTKKQRDESSGSYIAADITSRADEFAHFNYNILQQVGNHAIPVEQREMFANVYNSNHLESVEKFGDNYSDEFISGHELRFTVERDDTSGEGYPDFDQPCEQPDLNNTLLHFPYDRFSGLLTLIGRHASEIRHIVLSVYRLADDSQLVRLLIYLLQFGVKVTLLIEINAKGNEGANIRYAHELKTLGAQVLVADSIKKNHAKFIYLDMSDEDPVAMVMTGNLNEATANIYEDYCLITRDPDITTPMRESITQLITGMKSVPTPSDTIFFTQRNAVHTLVQNIKEQTLLGEHGRIIIKCNLFTDPLFMGLLDNAASNGCKIDLIVRGECCWKPTNTNITVHRYLHKYLEHSRVYAFGEQDPKVYIGSLDLATHKLFGRFELICWIKDNAMARHITDILNGMLSDKTGRHYVLGSYLNHHRYFNGER